MTNTKLNRVGNEDIAPGIETLHLLQNASSPVSQERGSVLRELCRQGSLSRMKTHSRIDDIQVEEVKPGASSSMPESGEWLSVIFVASKAIKILFKTHYATKDVQDFASHAWAKSDTSQVSDKMVEDFVKEFCNLSAGFIKKAFEDQETESKISLPLVTRASDDMFFSADLAGGKQIFVDEWILKNPRSSIACSVVIQVFEKEALEKMILPSFGCSDDGGDVEFL